MPSTAPALQLAGKQFIGWGGSERWLKTDLPAAGIRAKAIAHGGSATLFAGGSKSAGVFHPLPAALMKYHQRLKQQFDPRGILNHARMYPNF